jgi:hypothetical protein
LLLPRQDTRLIPAELLGWKYVSDNTWVLCWADTYSIHGKEGMDQKTRLPWSVFCCKNTRNYCLQYVKFNGRKRIGIVTTWGISLDIVWYLFNTYYSNLFSAWMKGESEL